MTNHVHLIVGTNDKPLQDIMRDLKRHTSKILLKTIEENLTESRREWLLWMMEWAVKKNPNNEKYQLWQQNNHPILIQDAVMFEQKLTYLTQVVCYLSFFRRIGVATPILRKNEVKRQEK